MPISTGRWVDIHPRVRMSIPLRPWPTNREWVLKNDEILALELTARSAPFEDPSRQSGDFDGLAEPPAADNRRG